MKSGYSVSTGFTGGSTASLIGYYLTIFNSSLGASTTISFLLVSLLFLSFLLNLIILGPIVGLSSYFLSVFSVVVGIYSFGEINVY